MFLAIGSNVFIFLCFHVVVRQKFFLFSLLMPVDVSVDVEATEKHLKFNLRWWINFRLLINFTLSEKWDINRAWFASFDWCTSSDWKLLLSELTKKETMYPQSVYCIHSGNSQSIRSPLKPNIKAPLNWIWKAFGIKKILSTVSLGMLTNWMMVKYFFHHKYLFICGPMAESP